MFWFQVCQQNTLLSKNQLQTITTTCVSEWKPVLAYVCNESRAEKGNHVCQSKHQSVYLSVVSQPVFPRHERKPHTQYKQTSERQFDTRAGLGVRVLVSLTHLHCVNCQPPANATLAQQ